MPAATKHVQRWCEDSLQADVRHYMNAQASDQACGWQEERADKLQLLAIYNARLTEREYRRAFILERGLLNVKRFQVSMGASFARATRR